MLFIRLFLGNKTSTNLDFGGQTCHVLNGTLKVLKEISVVICLDVERRHRNKLL